MAAMSVASLCYISCSSAQTRKNKSYGGAWAATMSSVTSEPPASKAQPGDTLRRSSNAVHIRTNLGQVGSDIKHMTSKGNLPKFKRRNAETASRTRESQPPVNSALVDNR